MEPLSGKDMAPGLWSSREEDDNEEGVLTGSLSSEDQTRPFVDEKSYFSGVWALEGGAKKAQRMVVISLIERNPT